MSKTQQRFGLLLHGSAFEGALLPIEALVEAWCDEQRATFDGMLRKASELHTSGGWLPSSTPATHAATVDALLETLGSAIHAFHRMKLPARLVRQWLQHLALHIDAALQEYALLAAQGLPSADEAREVT